MAQAPFSLPQALPQRRGFLQTQRKDNWWIEPLLVFLGFGAFIVYANWAAFQGKDFCANAEHLSVSVTGGAPLMAHYISPMYSPLLFDMPGTHTGHAWFGEAPRWLAALPYFSPAFLILWAPGGFRFTCYYYRGSYYKAFWADPVACSIGEPRNVYLGERWLPLVLQNVHRYFLYVALVFIGLLAYDGVLAYWFTNPATKAGGFGIGVGSIVMTLNPIFLGCYTLGCHSLRHLVGGRHDEISKQGVRKPAYDCVSCLNRRHMMWAWISLFWVGFTDFYVRGVSAGWFTDFRIL